MNDIFEPKRRDNHKQVTVVQPCRRPSRVKLYSLSQIGVQVNKAYFKSLYGFEIELEISSFSLKSFNEVENITFFPACRCAEVYYVGEI